MVTLFCYNGVALTLSYALAFEKIPIQFLISHFHGTKGIMFSIAIAIGMTCTGFLLIVWGPGHEQRWRKAITDSQNRT
jgi:hypothetical protein